MQTILDQILARSGFSPTTQRSYARVLQAWYAFAGTDPAGWTQPTAQAFYDDLLARGVAPQSARTYVRSLRYVSRWYATQAGRPELDFAVVQVRRKSRSEMTDDENDDNPRHALTRDQAVALIGACGDDLYGIRDRTLLIVGLETGMRRMSLAGATFDNLSRRGSYPTLKVPIKGTGGAVPFAVPLSSTAMRAIEDLCTRLRVSGKSGPIFPRLLRGIDAAGRATIAVDKSGIGADAIYKVITSRAERAGMIVHPHLLRYTFITWRQLEELNPLQIASITGHKIPGMGAVATYIDMAAIAEQARESTPAWFAQFVSKTLEKP